MRNIFQKIVLTKHRLAWWVAGQSQWGQSEEKARALGQRGRLWSTWEEPWGQAQKFWVLSRKSCAYYFSIQIINWFREKKKISLPNPYSMLPTAYIYSSKHSMLCLQHRRPRFDPWVGKIAWRRASYIQPTPVFWPGESHGLAGYSSWGHRVRHYLATKPAP